jgi:chemotaxis family two-component system response regulator PixG
MKIMIVDDDATTLTVIGAALQSHGHEVIERDTAIGTTLAILRQKPDIVLLDVRMPGIAGDKLAALIQQEVASRPIVILHSSLPVRDLEELVRSTGAAGFVAKGAGPASFLGMFERIVAAAQRGQARKQA